MAGFFYNLGRALGPKVRKANWVFRSLTGTETEAIQAEYEVGRDLAATVSQQLQADLDPAVERTLQDIGTRLAGCLKNKRWRFSFRGVSSPQINAFALPGGFVFLTRPLLHFCQWNRDEMAFVLAHEMAHVLRGHAIERLIANSVISAAVGRWGVSSPLMRLPLGNLVISLLQQGYSQDQEFEADQFGIRLTAAAGFDAAAALQLLARLRHLTGDPSAQYFSSHPPVDVRIQRIASALHTH